jgi:hypothetical protein
MRKFEKAPADANRNCQRLVRANHPDLEATGAKVDIWFVRADPELPETPLKLHGYRCYAVVKVNSPKLRAQGHGDAEITVDGDAWDEMDTKSRAALLDHELEHLAVRCDKEGEPTFDKYGRPRLWMRLHDHQFGWFDAIARRHGEASLELQQFASFAKVQKRLWDPDYEEAGDEEVTSVPMRKKKAAAQ